MAKVGDVITLKNDDDTETAAIVTHIWTDENGTDHVDVVTFPHGEAPGHSYDVFAGEESAPETPAP